MEYVCCYLRAGVFGVALLQSPGGNDIKAFDHHGVWQQRGQIFSVRLGILVYPPVVTHIHQYFTCGTKEQTP